MKKNIASMLLGAATVILISGCIKDQSTGIHNPSVREFKASIENPATKTILDRTSFGGKILWKDKESIRVNGKTYNGIADSNNRTFATFTADADAAVPDADGKFIAVYPYSYQDPNTKALTLNSTQLYDDNNGMDKVFPMCAVTTSDSDNFEFKNVCGLLEIILKGSAKVNLIKVSDSDKALSGVFTLDNNMNAVISDHSTKAGITLDCQGALLTEEGTKFYIAIPAETYNALTITILSSDGIKWSITAKKPATIQRSMVYSLEFTPELGSAIHEKVQLWENGPYWATTNIGAAKPTDSGMFFSWGNIDGYIWDGVTLDGKMAGYQFVESPWYDWTTGGQIDEGSTSSPAVLNASQDAAAVIWGDGWRMPTSEEATEFGKLDSEYDEDSNSLKVYSSVDPMKYIEFGLNGYFGGAEFSARKIAGIWTNTSRGKNTQAYVILFQTTGKVANNAQKRWVGFNIRPVCDK